MENNIPKKDQALNVDQDESKGDSKEKRTEGMEQMMTDVEINMLNNDLFTDS